MKSQKMIVVGLMVALLASYSGLAFAAQEQPAVQNVSAETKVVETAISNIGQQANVKVLRYETLPKIKNASSNSVAITDYGMIIPKGDVFKVSFAQDFTTKNLKVGDKIIFNLNQGLTTQEGTLLIPAGTQIVAKVQSYEPPKAWNRNAKVMLDFSEILVPNETTCSMGACVYGKYNVLQRSAAWTVAKPVAWTVGMFGVGAGIGAAIGAAANAVGIGCFAIGMPVGAGVGLIIGLVTPGLHYKAKAGKEIPIILNQDMILVRK